MPKKNIQIALSSLALLSATTAVQAEELLDYATLGTGEEIRADILPVASDEDQDSDDQEETEAQRKARKKKEAEQKKNKGKKSSSGKCGEGTCS